MLCSYGSPGTHLPRCACRGLDLVLDPGQRCSAALHFCHKRTQGRQGAVNSNTGDGEAPAGTPKTGGTMHGTQWCSLRDECKLCWATAGIEAPLGVGWSCESIRRH